MKHNYVIAVASLLTQGMSVDVVLANLEQTLRKKGHLAIHKDILRGLQVELSRKKQSDTPIVSVARVVDAETLKSTIGSALAVLGEKSVATTTVIDETLIGGFILNHKGKTIDASHKNKLLSLYRNITK